VTNPEDVDLMGPLPGMVFGRLDRSGGGLLAASSVSISEALQAEALTLAIDRCGYKPESARFESPGFGHVRSNVASNLFFVFKVVPTPSAQQPCRIMCVLQEDLYRRLGCSPFRADALGLFTFSDEFVLKPLKGSLCRPAFLTVPRVGLHEYQPLSSATEDQLTESASVLTVLRRKETLVLKGAAPSPNLNSIIDAAIAKAGPTVAASFDIYSFTYGDPLRGPEGRPVFACAYDARYSEDGAYARQLPQPFFDAQWGRDRIESTVVKTAQSDTPTRGDPADSEVTESVTALRAQIEDINKRLSASPTEGPLFAAREGAAREELAESITALRKQIEDINRRLAAIPTEGLLSAGREGAAREELAESVTALKEQIEDINRRLAAIPTAGPLSTSREDAAREELAESVAALRAQIEDINSRLIAVPITRLTNGDGSNSTQGNDRRGKSAMLVAALGAFLGIVAIVLSIAAFNTVKVLQTHSSEMVSTVSAFRQARDSQLFQLRGLPKNQRFLVDNKTGFLDVKSNATTLSLSADKQNSRLIPQSTASGWTVEPATFAPTVALSFATPINPPTSLPQLADFRLLLSKSKDVFILNFVSIPGESPRLIGFRRLQDSK
jgi:hypothetical protein